ncbi:magnesium chelatase subunit D [Salibaculum griseiflavum]|uniref:Magnesium chelatase ATPase subunit D n=1 Tax=Salibaculum griseiflavum TaxID=1914409 RepID=A0A2V1P234_9RHOB|nr:magnesium chelatase subunit D [Salibaculum griseiflavum]PWG15830.1 magnesium chelatase ATPase subunit D [Salibaculum griseiflavum]
MSAGAPLAWTRAMRAMAALSIDPVGLGGLTLRARAGPVRQTAEAALARLPGPQRRIHPDLSDTQLFGGINIAASLAEGRMVRDAGLVDTPALVILPMAERCPPRLAARLGQVLDAQDGHALVLLDEGAEPEEAAAPGLLDRLAFHVDLSDLHWADVAATVPPPGEIDLARTRLTTLHRPDAALEALTALAVQFGIDSLRAPSLALAAALALTALDGAESVTGAHVTEAAELVYPARATRHPESPPVEPEHEVDVDENATGANDPEGTDAQDDTDTAPNPEQSPPDDMLIEAVAALLPDGLLDRVAARTRARAARSGGGSGARRHGNRIGRPLPARPGHPDGRARIDVVATLRAAAPWQALRPRRETERIVIHPSDIRLSRYEDRSDRLIIFAVDASGSAAMARLAEAKGAVELLLGQAYARRDHVAVVAFRGTGADTLLPPTRSLVQAKRRLQALPGGGGTPLAAGLDAAAQLAAQARAHGLTPAIALLTDGRANIALDGTVGRAQAHGDGLGRAQYLRTLVAQGCVIDTSQRPGTETIALAEALGVACITLPRADAHGISSGVTAALDA